MLIGRIPIIAASIAGVSGLTAGVLAGKAPDMPKGWKPIPGERLAAIGISSGGGIGAFLLANRAPGTRFTPHLGALGVLAGTFLLGQAIGSAFKAPSHKS